MHIHTRQPKPLLMMHIIMAICATLLVACASGKPQETAALQPSEAIPVMAIEFPEAVVVSSHETMAAAQLVAERATASKPEEPNAQQEEKKTAHSITKKKKSAEVLTKNVKLPEDTLAKLTVPEKQLIVDRQYNAYVWIGPKSKTPETNATELSGSVSIPHPTKFAKIILTFIGKANGLQLDFVGGNCHELSPDGTYYLFTITARIEGDEYKVGAQVELHNLVGCTDTPHGLPTDFKPISVKAISMLDLVLDKLRPVFAEKVIELLTALLAIGVLFIIWIFKKNLFQRFGYKDEK